MQLYTKEKNSYIENLYDFTIYAIRASSRVFKPYLRRMLRFVALPYLFFYQIDWNICKKPKLKAIGDILYIFFKLKYYPDNYYLCNMWRQSKDQWLYYYGSIYDPHQRKKFEASIYDKRNIVVFENKYICHQLCLAANIPLPKLYSFVDLEDNCIEIIKNTLDGCNSNLIIKMLDGCGGKGILLCYKQNDSYFTRKGNHIECLNNLVINYPVIIQEHITQHPFLCEFSSSSLNTIRLVTLYTKNNSVLLVGSFIRFGVGDAYLDNLSSGGIAVGVDISNGILMEEAVDFNGIKYKKHPTSAKSFQGVEIPYWQEVVILANKVQHHFKYHKLLGLDICITKDGPLLIEINAEPDMVALEMTYGPIFAREEVWQHFVSHDLLINDKSKKLYKTCMMEG